MRPKLFQVYPTDEYSVYLYYDNGEIRIYDCKWILHERGIFTQIHSIESFKKLCTIMNDTLAWDISGERDLTNCIDICPDTVYQESIKAKIDPVKNSA